MARTYSKSFVEHKFKPSVQYNYPLHYYDFQYFLRNTPLLKFSAAKKEYSRLRSVANKRIQRLKKGGLSSKSAMASAAPFPKLKDLNEEEVYYELEAVVKFLTNPKSTAQGIHDAFFQFQQNMRNYIDIGEDNWHVYTELLKAISRYTKDKQEKYKILEYANSAQAHKAQIYQVLMEKTSSDTQTAKEFVAAFASFKQKASELGLPEEMKLFEHWWEVLSFNMDVEGISNMSIAEYASNITTEQDRELNTALVRASVGEADLSSQGFTAMSEADKSIFPNDF